MGGSWASTTAAYWAQRDKPNVLICSFKEMRRDLAGSVNRVAEFLGVNASPEILQRVVERSSFAYMKTIDDKFGTGKFLSLRSAAPMIRKGSEGGSSELITPGAGSAHRQVLHRRAEKARIGLPVRGVLSPCARRRRERAGAAGHGQSMRREEMRTLGAGVLAAAVVVTWAAAPALAQAPSGEAVYKQNCAACHEGNLPRMPTRAALRGSRPSTSRPRSARSACGGRAPICRRPNVAPSLSS
jgi:mono/diheme cytochrome c family protein